MAKLVITGIPAYNGEYDLDLEAAPLNNGELHTIKKLSGIRAGELDDALEAGDSDLIVALAAVVLKRVGRPVMERALWDATPGQISIVGDPEPEDEDDVGPPDVTPSDGSLPE